MYTTSPQWKGKEFCDTCLTPLPTLYSLAFDAGSGGPSCHPPPSFNPSQTTTSASIASVYESSAWQAFKGKSMSLSLTITMQPGKRCFAKLQQRAPSSRHADHPYVLMIECVLMCVSACKCQTWQAGKEVVARETWDGENTKWKD